jgi:homocysteine S-methyltransferase
MAECLDNCGVDVILVETMNTLREAVVATKSAVITGRPTLVSVVCGSDGRLLSGESISVAAKALAALKPDALLINCAPAPGLHRTLADLRASTSLPIGAYGNVGVREDNGIWIQTDAVQPAAYATYAGRWRRVGAKLIGGCCGTGPAHIAALRNDFPR